MRNGVYLRGYDGETDFTRERVVHRAGRTAREVARFVPLRRRLSSRDR